MAGLVDAFGLDEFLEGDGDDFQVCHQGYVIHIPDIEFELLCPAEAITTMTLCPARDARTHLMPASLLWGIQGHIPRQQRPWSNQRPASYSQAHAKPTSFYII